MTKRADVVRMEAGRRTSGMKCEDCVKRDFEGWGVENESEGYVRVETGGGDCIET